MSPDWADSIAQRVMSRGLIERGVCLVLGAADTGKTTLVAALARHGASTGPVAIVDADIGQSHIGPPTTVGWAIVDTPETDFSQLSASGISFVGDVTPVGRLLQLTAAITQCVRQALGPAELVIIDTPGLVTGPAARALWWTVQRILQPRLILAVQRGDELREILSGLSSFDCRLELIEPPPQIPLKSPERRRSFRRRRFSEYFREACVHTISLSTVAVQTGRSFNPGSSIGRLVALRDEKGTDMAVGLVVRWEKNKDIAVIRAPRIDIERISCLVMGDLSIDVDNL
ncbi:MAG: Clp1/GlmU family protein [Planctomycetota bacterium]|jgi:polynucleotide 5'-hydroxyl-kinase GRC3/NOL9